MKKRGKTKKQTNAAKFICFLICIAFFMPRVQIQAGKSKNYWPKLSEKIQAGSAILIDVDTGTILYKKKIDKKYYPASITKILTTLIAVENSSMNEVVTFSEDAVYKTDGSGIWRDIGEKMTMEQCLYAVMLESANECAYAVAEHIAGSLEAFVKMMNERAKEIGCTSSHFMNPHGLPDPKHYVSAKDMALIAREAYQNETFRLFCGTKKYTIPPTNKHDVSTPMVNHHKMLYPKDTAAYLYEYCTGGKTGWTSKAGNTLVTYAEKDGMTLAAVILNGTSPSYWNETRALFEFGFENFNLCNVAEYAGNDESYMENSSKFDSLNVNEPYAQIDPQSKIILPKTASFNKAKVEISYDNLPEDVLAQLKYTYGSREIGTADLVRTNAAIDKNAAAVSGADLTSSSQSEENTVQDIDQAKDDIKTSHQEEPSVTDEEESKEESSAADEKKKSEKKKFDFSSFSFKNFNIKDFFSNMGKNLNNFRKNISLKTIIIFAGIIALMVLIVILKIIFNNSYVIRQKIANFKNKRRAKKQYIIIRDTRSSRRRRRRKRW